MSTRSTPTTDTATPPPAKRRTRGPNKPKPGAIEVAQAEIIKPKPGAIEVAQAEIIKLLTAHAIAQLGAAGAEGMELQINHGDGWIPLGDANGAIRFATGARSRP